MALERSNSVASKVDLEENEWKEGKKLGLKSVKGLADLLLLKINQQSPTFINTAFGMALKSLLEISEIRGKAFELALETTIVSYNLLNQSADLSESVYRNQMH